MTNTESFTAHVRHQLHVAFSEFCVTRFKATDIHIEYKKNGNSVGLCKTRREMVLHEATNRMRMMPVKYTLVFSIEAIEKYYDKMVSEVIPHEIAHLIANEKPLLGAKNHNKVWKRICLSLGGTGERCHDFEVTPARKTRKSKQFIYQVGSKEVVLGCVRHNRLQKNEMRYHVNGHEIKKEHFVKCV